MRVAVEVRRMLCMRCVRMISCHLIHVKHSSRRGAYSLKNKWWSQVKPPIPPRHPAPWLLSEYAKSGATLILSRGQRNAHGRRGAADAPLVVSANCLLSRKSCETFRRVLVRTPENKVLTSCHSFSCVGRRSNRRYHRATPGCYRGMPKLVHF